MKYDGSNPKHVLARALARGLECEERRYRRHGVKSLARMVASRLEWAETEAEAARRDMRESSKRLRCAKSGCEGHPMLPGAWCLFHEPYDEAKRAAGVFRVGAQG